MQLIGFIAITNHDDWRFKFQNRSPRVEVKAKYPFFLNEHIGPSKCVDYQTNMSDVF